MTIKIKSTFKLYSNESFLLMLFVGCLAYFLSLKNLCNEYCHLHIQESEYLLAFQGNYHRYIYIYIFNKSGAELTAELTFVLCLRLVR